MSEFLARDLEGKSIVKNDGTTIGTLYNVTMNPESGALCELVVDQPKPFSSKAPAETGDGRLRIPVSLIKSVNDKIVINTN